MGLKNLFHKIKTGFARLSGKSIPNISSTKRYGDSGEESFIGKLKTELPFSRIKRNIIINTSYGNAEIDCLVLYRDKLFAIEVKRWKGCLTETDNGFIQEKTDRWTGEIHSKYQKSPFKQLNRAIYLLRKEISRVICLLRCRHIKFCLYRIVLRAEIICIGGKSHRQRFFRICISKRYDILSGRIDRVHRSGISILYLQMQVF